MEKEQIKDIVKERYGKVAKGGENSKECCSGKSCCSTADYSKDYSLGIGYSGTEIESVPDGANLGLGCGNPLAIDSLKEGETVLDLGSGAGFDCFLAAQKVGKTGKVIGVDMTEEMLLKARENAKKGGYEHVEFRSGEIEHLPVEDNSIDAVISNCVINLVPDKIKTFREIFRVLKSGGRFMISDLVLEKELPEIIRNSAEAYAACIAGAIKEKEYIEIIKNTGFTEVKVTEKTLFPVEYIFNYTEIKDMVEKMDISMDIIKNTKSTVFSIKVYGVKP